MLFIHWAAKADELFGDADDISSDDDSETKLKVHAESSRRTVLEENTEEEGDLVIADKVIVFKSFKFKLCAFVDLFCFLFKKTEKKLVLIMFKF